MTEYLIRDGIIVLFINNPPVNALSRDVIKSMHERLKKIACDDTTTAIVVCGKGGQLSAGADVTEFADMDTNVLRPVLDVLESSKKPVIAAIHGYAYGGGLELALASHYRIATCTAKVGLPEVRLGILPAAGGTQRLPRLVGLDIAMEWISSGKFYPASIAKEVGLIDMIVPENEDIVSAAIAYAKTTVGNSLMGKRTSTLLINDSQKADEIFVKHSQAIYKRSRGQIAPLVCIQAVNYSASNSFQEGMKNEEDLFNSLITSGQAKALQYSFFGERQVQKWSVPNTNINWRSANASSVKSGAVIGLGTMGRGIAINFLKAGIPIFVMERNESCLKAGLQSIHKILDDMAKHNVISEKVSSHMKNSVQGTLDYSSLKSVDLVIEAIIEEIKTKQEVFENLDRVCKPTAILATNTSALNIDEIASFTRRPSNVMGMHFFAPADRMRLLENVYGSETSGKTIATCMAIGRKMNKVTVLVGNCYGFVANRMYINYMTEAEYLLEEGSSPSAVDKALTDYGFAMGRFLVADLSGNDVLYRVRRAAGLTIQQQPAGCDERFRNGKRYCPLADLLCSRERFGFKTRKGWYDYKNKENNPEPSDTVRQMIVDYRRKNSINPRRIDHQEVIERTLYPLINEGFKTLEEGYAANPTDVDMIWIHGYAWPKHTGGPMFYAHTIGLPKLLEVLQRYHTIFGDSVPHWKPSKMLVYLVQQYGNPPLEDWMKYAASRSKSNL